jgi:hypothetical protein
MEADLLHVMGTLAVEFLIANSVCVVKLRPTCHKSTQIIQSARSSQLDRAIQSRRQLGGSAFGARNAA